MLERLFCLKKTQKKQKPKTNISQKGGGNIQTQGAAKPQPNIRLDNYLRKQGKNYN